MGHRTTPSYVAFNKTERLIGEHAMFQAALNAQNTIFDTKRLIGRKFADTTVQEDMKHWPFKVVAGSNNCPMIEVEFKGEKKSFRAEEISAMLLTKMKSIAETYLGKKVKNAVITVPAFFNDGQRQSTKDAGHIAGLNVLRILSEPTAAAIAYGYHQRETAKNILVFDLGGGTFDVSILNITNGIFEVKATAGDTHLGGEDFDNRLVDFFVKQFQQKHQKDISNNPRSLRRLRTACERAKRALSSCTQASIDIDSLHENIDFVSTITIGCFQDMCHDYFQRCIDICEGVVRDAKIDKRDVDEIVLVGGSTRIPKIQSMLSALFNGRQLNQSINTDEAVAYGATLQAAMLSDVDVSDKFPRFVLNDVTPLSLGIEIVGDRMSTIVKRNTTIPCTKTERYTTAFNDQVSMRMNIYEGERSMIKDNYMLAEFTLQGLLPLPRGKVSVDVTFDIDANGTLNVSAVDESNGNENKITITNDAGRLTKEDIERMVAMAEFYKSEDEASKNRAKAKYELETYSYEIKAKIRSGELRGHLTVTVQQELDDALEKALQFSTANPTAESSEYDKELKDLKAVTQRLLPRIDSKEN